MIQISSISNYEVWCSIKVPSQEEYGHYVNVKSVILLNENLEIKLLGLKGDVMITPDDLTPPEIEQMQLAINDFFKIQNAKELDLTKDIGSVYKVQNTILLACNSDAKEESQWFEVSELSNKNVLNQINDFFKTHFDKISFRS